jgi:hypothetical protein
MPCFEAVARGQAAAQLHIVTLHDWSMVLWLQTPLENQLVILALHDWLEVLWLQIMYMHCNDPAVNNFV